MTDIKEIPILFSTPMVQAILDGCKSMTRRIIKPQPELFYVFGKTIDAVDEKVVFKVMALGGRDCYISPPHQPGDRLWVKETWSKNLNPKSDNFGGFEYKADYEGSMCQGLIKWKSSRFMPKAAARLWLEDYDVRVERLQDITEDDARAEGASLNFGASDPNTCRFQNYRDAFRALWNSLNAKPKPVYERGDIIRYESYPFEDIQETRTYRGKPWLVIGNPWVWVIEFKRLEADSDVTT